MRNFAVRSVVLLVLAGTAGSKESQQLLAGTSEAGELIDLTQATVVTQEQAGEVERTAAQVLVEEVQKRRAWWQQRSQFPATGPAIVLAVQQADSRWSETYPSRKGKDSKTKAEGFRVVVTRRAQQARRSYGSSAGTARALYGVGQSCVCFSGRRMRPVSRRRRPGLGSKVSDSRASVGIPPAGELVRRLERGSIRAVHPRPFPVRLQCDREHSCAEDAPDKTNRFMVVPPTEMHRSLSKICIATAWHIGSGCRQLLI